MGSLDIAYAKFLYLQFLNDREKLKQLKVTPFMHSRLLVAHERMSSGLSKCHSVTQPDNMGYSALIQFEILFYEYYELLLEVNDRKHAAPESWLDLESEFKDLVVILKKAYRVMTAIDSDNSTTTDPSLKSSLEFSIRYKQQIVVYNTEISQRILYVLGFIQILFPHRKKREKKSKSNATSVESEWADLWALFPKYANFILETFHELMKFCVDRSTSNFIMKASLEFYSANQFWNIRISLLFISIVWQFSRHFNFYDKESNRGGKWYNSNDIQNVIDISNNTFLEIVSRIPFVDDGKNNAIPIPKSVDPENVSPVPPENDSESAKNEHDDPKEIFIQFLSNIFSKIVDGHQLAMILSVFQIENEKEFATGSYGEFTPLVISSAGSPSSESSNSSIKGKRNLDNLKHLVKLALQNIDKIRISHFPSFLGKLIDDCMDFF
jgi:hypothetical protein